MKATEEVNPAGEVPPEEQALLVAGLCVGGNVSLPFLAAICLFALGHGSALGRILVKLQGRLHASVGER